MMKTLTGLKIQNSYSNVNITGSGHNIILGGIVAYYIYNEVYDVEAINNCYNAGYLECNSDDISSSYIGGITGCIIGGDEQHPLTINKCYNTGNIIGSGNVEVGGIIGFSGKTIILNSYNTGDVYGGITVNGGMAGEAQNSSICNSYNIGKVRVSGMHSGGIVGHIWGRNADSLIFDNVFNIGAIEEMTALNGVYIADEATRGIVENAYYVGEGNAIHSGTYTGTAMQKTMEEIRSRAFIDTLNANLKDGYVRWILDRNGYPTLSLGI